MRLHRDLHPLDAPEAQARVSDALRQGLDEVDRLSHDERVNELATWP
jgi:hypothetical protein